MILYNLILYIYISYRIKLLELTTTNILQIHYRYPILHIYIILIYTYIYIYTLSQSNMYIIQYYIWHMYIYIYMDILIKQKPIQSSCPARGHTSGLRPAARVELDATGEVISPGKMGIGSEKIGISRRFHGIWGGNWEGTWGICMWISKWFNGIIEWKPPGCRDIMRILLKFREYTGMG